MRMEQLSVDHKLQYKNIIYDYCLGPYNIQGSEQFACVFKTPDHEFHLTVH